MDVFIRHKDMIDNQFKLLANRCQSFWNWEQHPVMHVEVRPAKDRKSTNQNSLYWKWLEELSAYLTKNGRYMTKDQVHEAMCHKFLGYREVLDPNGKVIGHTLNTTTSPRLDVGEMTHYMEQVDAWAQDIGCYLPTPADSAHAQMIARQKK